MGPLLVVATVASACNSTDPAQTPEARGSLSLATSPLTSGARLTGELERMMGEAPLSPRKSALVGLPETQCRGHLCARPVDDEVDYFGSIPEAELPVGLRKVYENVSNGTPGAFAHAYLAFASPWESPAPPVQEQAAKWLTSKLPAGRELVWGRTRLDDQEAFRTYVVGPSFVGDDDVADSRLDRDHGGRTLILVSLGPEGTNRFSAATEKLAKRRIALLVESEVWSAPLVIGRIDGGSLVFGALFHSEDEMRAAVERLRRKTP